jgi:uncharacterized protein involved in outer membrane biogenesis
MRAHRRLVLVLGLLVVVVTAGTVLGLAPLARWIAIARLHALTERPVAIEAVALNLLTGRVTVRGLRLTERDGVTPFADIERLDARVRWPALLLGHLRVRELVVEGSTVRVVRLPGGAFNFSDLIEHPGAPARPLDVTVDRFALTGGTITLDDRALPEPRTWSSEQITIEAHNVSTRRADGWAVGRSVTGGAPLSVEIRQLRLHPVHLTATLTTEGVDLSPLRLYFPPDAPIVLVRGRASSAITVTLDAHDGLRVDATGRLEDIALGHADGVEPPLALVPSLRAQIAGFGARDGELRLARLVVDGTMSVREPSPRGRGRYPLSRVQASVSDLTWPATTSGRLDVLTSIPGGGTLSLAGTLRPPPDASQLRLRIAGANLAPWSQLFPIPVRIGGLAQADLQVNAPLAPEVPTRVQGAVAVDQLAVTEGGRELLAARRVEARGLELQWPRRLVVTRVQISGPRGAVQRDRDGAVSVAGLSGARDLSGAREQSSDPARPASTPTLGAEIHEVVVSDGRLIWRDETVSPPATLALSGVDASVSNAAWPLRGPLGVRAAVRPPGGGQLRLSGQVGVDPMTAELTVTGTGVELAPYQPYLPTAARLSGAAEVDLVVTIPSLAERRATARGSVTLSRLDVRDGERTVARVERAAASALTLDWPERLSIGRVALTRPWLLVERDSEGGLALRTLLAPTTGVRVESSQQSGSSASPTTFAVSVGRVSVEDGGVRVVDQAVSPAFAVDVDSTRVQIDGLSTTGATPARVDLRGRIGAGAEFAIRGTVAAFGGPLRLDVSGELEQFAVPRANPYLLRQVGWQTREGRLSTSLRCRLDGDALSAHTDVRVSRLQLVRASSHDEAQTRIGLPLGLITALLKDRRGDIVMSFPVGGRLNDPRFDFRDAIWSAMRTVAVNAITLPVSWIGRVHFTPDSRIERIQVDPVTFEPGTATLTQEGQGQMSRLAAFLDRLPQVTLGLTPIVSAADAEALKARLLDTELERLAAKSRLARDDAATRLFEQRFPGRPVPDSVDARLGALREQTPLPEAALPELARRRLQVMRDTVRQAGIDVGRRLAEAPAQERATGGSRVEIDVREPEGPRGSVLRDTLRRLGAPFRGPEARE